MYSNDLIATLAHHMDNNSLVADIVHCSPDYIATLKKFYTPRQLTVNESIQLKKTLDEEAIYIAPLTIVNKCMPCSIEELHSKTVRQLKQEYKLKHYEITNLRKIWRQECTK